MLQLFSRQMRSRSIRDDHRPGKKRKNWGSSACSGRTTRQGHEVATGSGRKQRIAPAASGPLTTVEKFSLTVFMCCRFGQDPAVRGVRELWGPPRPPKPAPPIEHAVKPTARVGGARHTPYTGTSPDTRGRPVGRPSRGAGGAARFGTSNVTRVTSYDLTGWELRTIYTTTYVAATNRMTE